MNRQKVLLLGGTGEARAIAEALTARGIEIVSSLAGVTAKPALPPGRVRKGGFGGQEGLREYLKKAGIGLIADATHPFAATISAHAAGAAAETGAAYVRFERPAWQPGPGDRWTEVPDVKSAAATVPPGAVALVTVGRKEVAAFAARSDMRVLARMIEPPAFEPPANWRILLARPPFPVEDEMALMRGEGITILATKNAGGTAMEGKLLAARRLGIPVVMVSRPEKPPAETAATVEEMVELVLAKCCPHGAKA